MDHTATQMVLVVKLSSFAYSLFDGLAESSGKAAAKNKYAITQCPSLLEYFGWVFFFPGVLVGPAVEFSDYANFIDGTAFKVFIP